MTRLTAQQQLARVLTALRANPDSTPDELAPSVALTIDSTRTYLRLLERRGGVLTRLETIAEADARVRRMSATWSRRCGRRKLRYTAVEA